MKIAGLLRRAAACFLVLTCACALTVSSAQAAETGQHQTVKVAVLNNTTYADQGDDGVWRGLDVECMIAIAQKAGFDLTFIDSSNDPDFLGGLDNGTYDIVADVVKTQGREANYLFTDEAIGYTTSTLAVRSDDERWNYGNIEQLSQMKVGVLASYANNADFRLWCSKHSVTPAITEYQDIVQMTAALLDGEIDGEIYTAIYNPEDAASLRTIMKFLPESFYYAFRKDDTALKNQVDAALSQILAGNSDYLTNLKNKYEDQYGVNNLPFSSEEKAYIAEHPVLSVAVLSGDSPYYETNADGSAGGIIPDYYAMLAADTGLSFRYVAYSTQDDAIAAVKNGEADIVGVFNGGIISSQQYGLTLTDSFSSVNNILLTSSGTDLSGITSIAVVHRAMGSLMNSIGKSFPNAEITDYETAEECFRAMQHGDAAAVLIGLPSATWLINQTNSTSYNIIPVDGATSELCGAVDSGSQVLCSILNKRIESTKGSFTGLVTKDTLPKGDWKTTISRIPPAWSILIFVALLSLVLGLTWALVLLRRRQRERTAVLAAQAETEKQKLQVEAIQRSADERSRFFANISHDMRTPLNAITNFIRLAQKDGLPPQQQEVYLKKAEASSKLLLALIDDTLTVSKLSGGKLELQPQPCRMSELLEAVASPIREAAADKKIAFSTDVSALPEQRILADRLNIEKIFLNLLTNAVRYTPEGGRVWFSAVQEPDSGGLLCYTVTVRDDGIGISREFMPHLFEAFAQEKRPGYESVGTGLGLSIVKHLVSLMGGSIEVESEIGKGTSFAVHLMFQKAAAAEAERKPAKANSDALRGKKVLLCEDNALNREIAAELLGDKGMTVVSAENGKLGLDLFSSSAAGEYSAILMDIRMPVMDGYETTKAVRSLGRPDAGTVPIIAMTADAFADDVQKCLDAGMNGHVAKPIEPDALYSALAAALAEGDPSPA